MNANPIQLARTRQELSEELARNRRASMRATEQRDFRAVARLTLEAARLNRALAEMQVEMNSSSGAV